MNPTLSVEMWRERIDAARQRRERYESLWEFYARLHTNAYLAARDKNEDILVNLPNGDQVKAALVFRNIEQTMALLEVPEIGVRATATDYTQEIGTDETHREGVVEQALWRSLLRSGLIKGSEEADPVKRDGTIVGHGVTYTWWREELAEVEAGRIPVLEEGEDGTFAPAVGEDGLPVFETQTEQRIVWEGCQDEHISPLEFLFDATAKRMVKAAWHGYERPIALDRLRQDGRFEIPPELEGTTLRLRDLYGNEDDEEIIENAVLLICIWDKDHKELLHFLETKQPAREVWRSQVAKANGAAAPETQLLPIGVTKWPVMFSHPDASPFNFFIPIPAQDHPFGISQIEHIRNQATEADKLRTRQANITRQLRRILWYNRNRVDEKQVTDAINAADGNVKAVGLNLQENEKPGDLFGELPVPNIDPEIYRQYTVAETGVDKTTGVSDVPGGGADTATEAEHIFEIGNARPKRKKRIYLSYLSSVAGCHRDYLRTFSPEGETVIVPDVDGRPITLAYGREAFVGDFDIEVLAGGGAMSLSPVKQKMLLEASGLLLHKFGPSFDRVFLRQLLTKFDFPGINELMRAVMLDQGLGMMAGGTVPRPGVTPAEYTNPQTLRAGINAASEA